MKTVLILLALIQLSCSREPAPRSLAHQHARVDDLLQAGYVAAAERQLDDMWRTHHQMPPASDFDRQVTQDIAFRLGQVMLEEKKLGEALEVCTRGLALGERDDLFTANLLILRGHIRRELGEAVSAAEDFHRALVINEKLLGKVLKP